MALEWCRLCGGRYREWERHRYGPGQSCRTRRLVAATQRKMDRLRAGGFAPVGDYQATLRAACGDTALFRGPTGAREGRVTWAWWAPTWAVQVAHLRKVPPKVRQRAIADAVADVGKRAVLMDGYETLAAEAAIAGARVERYSDRLGGARTARILGIP